MKAIVYWFWCCWRNHRGFGVTQHTMRKGHQVLTFRECNGCGRVYARDAEEALALLKAGLIADNVEWGA